MGKRGGLGLQERDTFKRKKRKEEEKGRFRCRVLLEGIGDYLLSDSYMYVLLLFPLPTKGIRDYPLSDSYMYALLLSPLPTKGMRKTEVMAWLKGA